MDGKLLRVLIAKNFFVAGLEVDALYRANDMSGRAIVNVSGTFTVTAVHLNGADEVVIECSNIVDGRRKKFYAHSITMISGMDPVRFAASCGIDEQGEKIQEGKRRGRKPKNRIVEEVVDADDEDEDDLLGEIFLAAE